VECTTCHEVLVDFDREDSMTYEDAVTEICALVARGQVEEAGQYLKSIVDEVKAVHEDGGE
jgi:hypothetical protein